MQTRCAILHETHPEPTQRYCQYQLLLRYSSGWFVGFYSYFCNYNYHLREDNRLNNNITINIVTVKSEIYNTSHTSKQGRISAE